VDSKEYMNGGCALQTKGGSAGEVPNKKKNKFPYVRKKRRVSTCIRVGIRGEEGTLGREKTPKQHKETGRRSFLRRSSRKGPRPANREENRGGKEESFGMELPKR